MCVLGMWSSVRIGVGMNLSFTSLSNRQLIVRVCLYIHVNTAERLQRRGATESIYKYSSLLLKLVFFQPETTYFILQNLIFVILLSNRNAELFITNSLFAFVQRLF